MVEDQAQRLDRETGYALIVLAVVQGFALYLLQLAITHRAWPATDPRWLVGLYSAAVGLPLFLYLGVARLRDWRNLAAGLPLGLALFGLGWHLGWVSGGTQSPFGYGIPDFVVTYVVSVGISLFALAFLFRAWSLGGERPFAYARLLALSWQNALTLFLLHVFVLVFWLLLWLWAELFEALKISFFTTLFSKPIFDYPVTLLVVGGALVLIRNRIRLIATVQFMCEVLIKALLPLVALIVFAFLFALPFTGIHSLSRTEDPGFLMTVLDLVMLFFFNAVLSDSREEPPYPAALRWFVLAAIVLLAVNAGVSAWALHLRIGQHGLTDTRLWAVVVELLAAAYILPYAIVIVWRQRANAPALRRVNVVMAFVVPAVLLLVNTPLLDLRGISVHNQVSRLLSGKVSPSAFDASYLRFEAGRYGTDALHKLANSDFAARNPGLKGRIADLLKRSNPWETPKQTQTDVAVIRNTFEMVPAGSNPPDALLLFVAAHDSGYRFCDLRSGVCKLAKLADPALPDAWAVFSFSPGSASVYAPSAAGKWRLIGRLESLDCADCGNPESAAPQDTLRLMSGPYPVFSDGHHYFGFTPTLAYYKETAPGATPENSPPP